MLVFLSFFLILVISQFFLKKYAPPPQKPAPSTQSEQAPASAAGPATVSKPSTPTAATNAAATKAAQAEAENVVESDLYKVTFTNRGAEVKSWVLKKYDDDKGHPLDLVHPIAAPQDGYPLSLFTYDENLRKKLNSALWVASQDGKTLTFEYADAQVSARKLVKFDESYVAHVDVEVTQNGQRVAAYPAWPAGFGDQTVPGSYAVSKIEFHPIQPMSRTWYGGSKAVERLDIKHVSGGNTLRVPMYWGGTDNQYFAAIFLPDDPTNASLVTFRNKVKVPKDLNKPNPNDTIDVDVLGAAAGSITGHTSTRLFAGPKNLQILQTTRAVPVAGSDETPDLGTLLDLGMFSIIAKPLFIWLRWTHDHWVANWGWSIIILTIIINLALLPLRLSSMKSALKTAKIQPQIKAIRDRYKHIGLRDPKRAEANQKINQETAALMKEHGVNPVGGCLPMLIQFPFLIAFYTMLGNTTELRHATFFYLKDLSAPDPYRALPILIGITTFVVQKMTPQGGMDPQQQKMMNLMMPAMLLFISLNLSSGLGLYWVVGNLVAMAMQWGLNHSELGKEQRAIAAKRARKQAEK